ncbi:MAG: hypothetical protein GY701_32270, partial [Sulfitobacter sp.]|nr:hypothetical protein [Sulfitobacter sp.]
MSDVRRRCGWSRETWTAVTSPPRPLLVSPLRLLVALTTLIIAVTSGIGVAEAQNGVAAINLESGPAVAAGGDIGPGHVGSERLLFDDFVSGCCVAPSGLGDEFANYGGEFLDDATRFPTTRLDTPAGTFDVPPHAANSMA